MNDSLPPAARHVPVPRCVECQDYCVLWRHDFPAEFPLTQFGVGGKYLCERCALYLAKQRALMPFGPKLDDVRSLIQAKQREAVR